MLLVAAVLAFLAFCGDTRTAVSFEEINTSPALYSDTHPGEYSKDSAYISQSNSPKWGQTYRYKIVSLESSGFDGKDYLSTHPKDAVEIFGGVDGNTFIIFSDSLPDQRLFIWPSQK
jgi:hypothetical protein